MRSAAQLLNQPPKLTDVSCRRKHESIRPTTHIGINRLLLHLLLPAILTSSPTHGYRMVHVTTSKFQFPGDAAGVAATLRPSEGGTKRAAISGQQQQRVHRTVDEARLRVNKSVVKLSAFFRQTNPAADNNENAGCLTVIII